MITITRFSPRSHDFLTISHDFLRRVVRLMSIHYSDGTEWTTEDSQKVTAEGKL